MIRIRSIYELERAMKQKRAVIIPGTAKWQKPKPAAIIINLPLARVLKLLKEGIYLYEKPKKKEKNHE